MRPRPQDTDDPIYLAVARRLADCLGEDNAPPPADALVPQIVAALRTDRDAAVLAAELEHRWGLTDLGSIFEAVPSMMHDMHREAVRQWVTENQVRLDLVPGTRVDTPYGAGTIVNHDVAMARYLVEVDDLKRKMGDRHIGLFYEPERLTAL
jgi:hypothetical protein